MRTQQTSMFYSYIVLLIYVNETIYLLGNLSFFKIRVDHFMAWDDYLVPMLSQNAYRGEGPGVSLSFETSLFSN